MANLALSNIWRTAKLREKLIILVGIIYIISPIDLVPEVILGPLGLLDDSGAILVVLGVLWAAIRRSKSQNQTIIDGETVERKQE